jgi:hypothetical protein
MLTLTDHAKVFLSVCKDYSLTPNDVLNSIAGEDVQKECIGKASVKIMEYCEANNIDDVQMSLIFQECDKLLFREAV